MARMRFKKPKIAVLMSEIISLTIWLFLGDKIIGILDGLVGSELAVNVTGTTITTVGGCTNSSIFEDAYEILGMGYDCGLAATNASKGTLGSIDAMSNSSGGLLGVIGLVMVVMVLMNFVSYN